MLVNTPDGLKKEARWDGATGQSRQLLLQDLSSTRDRSLVSFVAKKL